MSRFLSALFLTLTSRINHIQILQVSPSLCYWVGKFKLKELNMTEKTLFSLSKIDLFWIGSLILLQENCNFPWFVILHQSLLQHQDAYLTFNHILALARKHLYWHKGERQS